MKVDPCSATLVRECLFLPVQLSSTITAKAVVEKSVAKRICMALEGRQSSRRETKAVLHCYSIQIEGTTQQARG